MVEKMTNEIYEKLQVELSQLLNTEKYKQMTSKNKDVYKQAVLACKSVVSHYKANIETEPKKHGRWIPGKEIAKEFLAGNVIHVDYLNYRCSVCGALVGEWETMIYHFCPNCGADMRERREDG